MSVTKLQELINPEVMAGIIESKFAPAVKFAPLAVVDNTLAGRAGDTITLPKFAYIGDATDVGEGEAIPIDQLTTSTATATVKKAAKGVELTDEAVLSGYGDPVGEAAKQMRFALAQKVDNDCMAALNGIKANMTVGDGTAPLDADFVADALVKYGEDVDGEKVLLIAAQQFADLRKDPNYLKPSDVSQEILMNGTIGSIHGCQIVITDKIKAVGGKYTNFIVKPGALAIFLKRDVNVETDRDIIHKTTVMTADKHYTTYLYDESKAIKLIAKVG